MCNYPREASVLHLRLVCPLFSSYNMVRVKSTSRKLLKPTIFPVPEKFRFPMCNESDDHGITVEVSIPSADEECPITQELMQSYDLEFLPNTTFISGYPAYRKLTLPCGHSFSAMALTYHFHKNCMQCPLCRVGSKQPLAPLYIPEHFRAPLQDRVVIERGQVLPQPFPISFWFSCIIMSLFLVGPGRRGAREPPRDPQHPPQRDQPRAA